MSSSKATKKDLADKIERQKTALADKDAALADRDAALDQKDAQLRALQQQLDQQQQAAAAASPGLGAAATTEQVPPWLQAVLDSNRLFLESNERRQREQLDAQWTQMDQFARQLDKLARATQQQARQDQVETDHARPWKDSKPKEKKQGSMQVGQVFHINTAHLNKSATVSVGVISSNTCEDLGMHKATPDTGAEACVAGLGFLHKAGYYKENLLPPEKGKLVSFDGAKVDCIGMLPVKLDNGVREVTTDVYFCPGVKHNFLLSLEVCKGLGYVPENFPEVIPINEVRTEGQAGQPEVPETEDFPGRQQSKTRGPNTWKVSEKPTRQELDKLKEPLVKSYSDVFSEDEQLPAMTGERDLKLEGVKKAAEADPHHDKRKETLVKSYSDVFSEDEQLPAMNGGPILSRAPVADPTEADCLEDEATETFVIAAVKNLAGQAFDDNGDLRDLNLERVKMAAVADPDYGKLMEAVTRGFPKNPKKLDPAVRAYWSVREELTVRDGLVVKGGQLVIPKQLSHGFSLRSKMPELIASSDAPAGPKMLKRAQKLRNKNRARYDHDAADLPCLIQGTVVRVKNPTTKKWDTTGTVLKSGNYRSYQILLDNGKYYWRNRRFIRPVHEAGRQAGVPSEGGEERDADRRPPLPARDMGDGFHQGKTVPPPKPSRTSKKAMERQPLRRITRQRKAPDR